jgi:arginine-tRNA-protein transferase
MLVDDYEALMLKGWRRCGDYYYKPDLKKSCCKLNTIRLDVYEYQMNKKQMKVSKRLNSYIEGMHFKRTLSKAEKRRRNKESLVVPKRLEEILKEQLVRLCEHFGVAYDDQFLSIQKNDSQKAKIRGDYTINSIKIIRAHIKKLDLEISEGELLNFLCIHLEERLGNTPWSVKSSEKGFIQLNEATPSEENAIYLEDENMNIEPNTHKFDLKLVSDSFHQEAFELYKKYQIEIHKDSPSSITPNGYIRFLCNSSLVPRTEGPITYGSFHLHYRIDGKLIAVGVVDILPSGLSSVYFFYDTDYKFLSPGVLSAIKEIEYVKGFNSDRFKYYYMGFYIESCKKMKYKGEFHPSELLCPASYVWVPLDDIMPYKDQHHFTNFKAFSEKTQNVPDDFDMDIRSIPNIGSFVDSAKLNHKGQLYKFMQRDTIIGILQEALPYFGKTMMTTLKFCF